MSRPILFVSLLLSLSGCLQTPGEVPRPVDWQSPHELDHPLVGRIWSSGDQAFITEAQLLQEIALADYLLLGEKHDNPDHHALRLQVLNRLFAAGAVAAVSMEMLDSSQASALAALLGPGVQDPQLIRDRLAWEDSGWDWEFYAPVLELVLGSNTPLLTANLSPAEVSARYRDPTPAFFDEVLSAPARALLREEIVLSHCNQLPDSQVPAMVRVQMARDWRMAESLYRGHALAKATGRDGASVLLAGNFHIRRDLSVPHYLQTLLQVDGERLISLAWAEVSPGSDEPMEYVEQGAGMAEAYDYVWFTPVVSQEDYCDSLGG